MMFAALLFAANQMYAQFGEEGMMPPPQGMRFGGPGGPGSPVGRGDMVQMQVKRLTKELQLTKDQAAEIEALYKEQAEARMAKMKKARQSGERPDMNAMREQMSAERAEMDAKIAEILTPEQNAKYLQLQAEREKNGMPHNGKKGDRGKMKGGKGPGGKAPVDSCCKDNCCKDSCANCNNNEKMQPRRGDMMQKLQSELDLTDDQVARIKQIMDSDKNQRKADSDKRRADTEKALQQVLTKEQYAKFQELKPQKRENR